MDVWQSATHQLAGVIASKTDDVLMEAVTRFLGRSDWTMDELKGRAIMQHLPNGIEVFCLDDVALLELHPLTVEHDTNGGNVIINATRPHRFLVPSLNSSSPS